MHFMKEGIFMNQEIIKATLLEQDDIDILRFEIDEEEFYSYRKISLNSHDIHGKAKSFPHTWAKLQESRWLTLLPQVGAAYPSITL